MGKQSHFFAVIEPQVSHSCKWAAHGVKLATVASCQLHGVVCVTLLKPAPLGMGIGSVRKSFIKMPGPDALARLPTVLAPVQVASVLSTRLQCQLPWTWTCGCRRRRVVCLWHKRLPVAAICIVNLFGALVKRCRRPQGAAGRWQVASCREKFSAEFSFCFHFELRWACLAPCNASVRERHNINNNGDYNCNWCCGIAADTSWACNLQRGKHVQILWCHKPCCCGIFAGNWDGCSYNCQAATIAMTMPRDAMWHSLLLLPHKAADTSSLQTADYTGCTHSRQIQVSSAVCAALLHVACCMLRLLLHLRADAAQSMANRRRHKHSQHNCGMQHSVALCFASRICFAPTEAPLAHEDPMCLLSSQQAPPHLSSIWP